MLKINIFSQKSLKRFIQARLLIKGSILLLIISLPSAIIFAQVTGQTNQLETNKGIVSSKAPYDADVREAILQASLHPDILTQLEKRQTQTVAECRSNYSSLGRI